MGKERDAVHEVISILKQTVSRSEFFEASPETPRDLCLKKAESCDVFVGIYKKSYGHIPTEKNPEEISVIEMEYDAAYKKKRPILIFIHSKASQSDSEKFLKFIQKITNFTYGRFRKTFKNPEELQYHLFASLVFNIFNLDNI